MDKQTKNMALFTTQSIKELGLLQQLKTKLKK